MKEEKTMTSAEAIVECLNREKISKVFCVPGESYLPVMDAIKKRQNIELISARHEGGASFMAEGYAKASGKPGVVLATRGVGASNLTIGVHTAYQDSTPMVVLLGQVHSGFRGREGFQEVDLEAFLRPISKWVAEIREPPRTAELVQRAFRIARTGRPGPVVLSLPEDVLKQTSSMVFQKAPVKIPKPKLSDSQIQDILDLLKGADRPVIIAGGGIVASGAEASLRTFAEKFDIPVLAAFRRHDVYPNDSIHYVGHLGLGLDRGVKETVQRADVILAVGTRLSEVTTQDYSLIQPWQKLIHIDISYDTLGTSFAPDVGCVADAKESLHSLNALSLNRTWEEWRKERRLVYERTLTSRDETLNGQIIGHLQATVPEDTIITNDAGNFAGWLHSFFQFRKDRTYIGPTSGAMGYGLPAAIGAKLASSTKKVVSLSGDGGFMMTMQELETAVRYHIPVISIVFNNRMYGTIRMHQEMHYPGEVIGTELGQVPFHEWANKVGAKGFYVKTASRFREVLEEALQIDGPVLIEIEEDRERISVGATIDQIRERHMEEE